MHTDGVFSDRHTSLEGSMQDVVQPEPPQFPPIMSYPDVDLPFTPPSQHQAEFVRFALTDLNTNCLVLSFLPLPPELYLDFPERILAPPSGSDVLDLTEVASVIRREKVVVGVCTLADERETEAARRILQQLSTFAPVTFVALLGGEHSIDECMVKHDLLLDMGVHDVIANPPMISGFLRRHVDILCCNRDIEVNRVERLLQEYQVIMHPRQLKALVETERSLLWDGLPRVMMPDFPRVDTRLHEDNEKVGGYRFVRQFSCIDGKVACAEKEDDQSMVAIKIQPKTNIHSANEVESIFREYRFLKDIITHPHIVKCLELLHTPNSVYMVMEHAGDENLTNICEAQPSTCLKERVAIDIFRQLVDGLAWMHQRSIVHRQVTPDHVAVQKTGEDQFHCKLVDFRNAAVSRGDSRSDTRCGYLPCLAPEVVLEGWYIPRFADCWSVGILLLEISGGLGSVYQSAGISDQEDGEDDLRTIANFFQSPNSHQVALGKVSGVFSPHIIGYLEQLVLVTPQNRAPMAAVVERLNTTPIPVVSESLNPVSSSSGDQQES